MAKRKHSKESSEETTEDKVLKKYHKYSKKLDNIEEESEEVVKQNTSTDDKEVDLRSDVKINENDSISAEKILKKVKKIKDKNTKNAIKLRKQSRKLAKKSEEQNKQISDNTNSGNKSESALKYLNDWKYRRNDWKFKKSLQIWLLKNWKNSNKINDKEFDLLIEYICDINKDSFAKKRLESEAKQLIDKQTEEEETKEDEEQEKVVERARKVMQCLV